MEKRKIDVKMSLSYSEVVAYLEDLLKSFRSRKIVVQKGTDHVVMTPPDQVGVKVEAKIKKDRQSIGFELSWVQSEPGDLTISDREPDAVAIRADTQPAPVAPAPAADAAIATESAQKKEKSAKKDEKQKTAKKERKLAEKADARKTESAKPRG
jgi:amphi-Trp domain-containing protein